MTNKEHLATLSAEEWVQRVEWLYHIFGRGYTQSLLAIKNWLNCEYTKVKPMQSNTFPPYYVCPVCYLNLINGDAKCPRCETDIDLSRKENT